MTETGTGEIMRQLSRLSQELKELSSRPLAVRPDLENRPESANSSHAPEKDARVPLDDIQSMIEFLK
jgi:hypothetical protein